MTVPDAPIFWTVVARDGRPVRQLRCPVCGMWGDLDDDQFHGTVSIDHSDQPGCTFHETINVERDGERIPASEARRLR